jgi:hypothetical protein
LDLSVYVRLAHPLISPEEKEARTAIQLDRHRSEFCNPEEENEVERRGRVYQLSNKNSEQECKLF